MLNVIKKALSSHPSEPERKPVGNTAPGPSTPTSLSAAGPDASWMGETTVVAHDPASCDRYDSSELLAASLSPLEDGTDSNADSGSRQLEDCLEEQAHHDEEHRGRSAPPSPEGEGPLGASDAPEEDPGLVYLCDDPDNEDAMSVVSGEDAWWQWFF